MFNQIKNNLLYGVFCILLYILIGLKMNAQDGTVAYNFLNLPSSAHIYGLGGVNISTVEDNINLADQNPALIGPEMDMQMGINYMKYVGDWHKKIDVNIDVNNNIQK